MAEDALDEGDRHPVLIDCAEVHGPAFGDRDFSWCETATLTEVVRVEQRLDV